MGSSSNTSSQQGKHGSFSKKSQRNNSVKAHSIEDRKVFIEHFHLCKGIYSKTLDGRVNDTFRHGQKFKSDKAYQINRSQQSENKMDRDSPVPPGEWQSGKENLQWFSKGKDTNSLKESSRWSKLSLQSLTEFDPVDSFLGPFSWKTKSLQDMAFPHSDNEEEAENRSSLRHCEELSYHYITLEGLREKLKRDYLEAQEQREKYRHMLSSTGSKCIQRTDESVAFIARHLGPGRSFSAPRSRFPLSPLLNTMEDRSKTKFSPVKLKPVFDGPSHSKYNDVIEDNANENRSWYNNEGRSSSDSDSDEPEVRLTVKQISEGLDKVLFKNKSPVASPLTPTAENVMDFLKDW